MNRIIVCLFILCFSTFGCNSKTEEMIFPENLELIHPGNRPCSACEAKVISYLNITERSLYIFSDNIVDWQEFADSYPDLSLVIYLGGKGKDAERSPEQIQSFFEKRNFPYPVYLDPEDQFFEVNHLDTVPLDNKTTLFFLLRGNEVLDLYEFGIPILRASQLEEHFGMQAIDIVSE
ncbi:TlpA family protein disulfide reductase [Algoriphagus vanfongensis]|uniref:TlpA family protein disulfide reductase n=1 Tax=Algoriphagus vanfongensis TaxID=426371 RepID=UPI0012FA6010|nr:hypothetical protein [Algoriphagus vanfongensis]